jgi:hypothetical protein
LAYPDTRPTLAEAMYGDNPKAVYDFIVDRMVEMRAAADAPGMHREPGSSEYNIALSHSERCLGAYSAFVQCLRLIWEEFDWPTVLEMANKESYARVRKEGIYADTPSAKVPAVPGKQEVLINTAPSPVTPPTAAPESDGLTPAERAITSSPMELVRA